MSEFSESQHDFEKPIDGTLFEPTLLALPTQRVGYSDRTSWLMSVMSQLAYFQFENSGNLSSIIDDLVKLSGREQQVEFLRSIIGGLDKGSSDDRKEALRKILSIGGFELVRVFNTGETQAFLARRDTEKAEGKMLVLAFRGTEKKLSDWKTDIKARLVAAKDENKSGRIHEGFQKAYYLVEDEIEKTLEETLEEHPGEPLYITGHSLGGALAVVATRFIDAGNLAACYTFGGPRVGDLELAKVFKTPIYRVVNASDAVPRLPFGYGWYIVQWLADGALYLFPRFKFLDELSERMEWISGYTHYGDQRYLSAVEPGAGDTYPNLELISNPGFFLALFRFFKRTRATKGKGLINDHSIGIYRSKLRARALDRNL